MASRVCTCPLPAAIGDIDKFDCAQTFGLVNRAIFRRFNTEDQVAGVNVGGFILSGDGASYDADPDSSIRFRLPVFLEAAYTGNDGDDLAANDIAVTANSINVASSWSALFAASDVTKIQATPLFSDTEVTPTDTIEVGGDDNTTPDGVPVVVGETSADFSALFKDVPSAVLKQIKGFACESNTGVFLIDERQAVLVQAVYDPTDDSILLGYDPTEISNIFVGSIQFGGRTDQNSSNFKFKLKPAWDDNLTVVALDFSLESLI
jgi:hypothetical protein